MQAPFEMTDGLVRLKSIITDLPPDSDHWNEAQNRFQFIDRLLTECLGWQKPDVEVEAPDDAGGRIDYILGRPAHAVLEAKREANVWRTLPTGRPMKVRKLAPMITASPEFLQAAKQVIGYCSLKGIPIAVVCNGPQLAIFQAISIGHPPLEGECFFFNGFSSYVDDFTLLWTLLSPEGITENRALREISRRRTPRIPPKASQAIPEPYRYRYRSDVQEELRQLGSLLLEEIEDNPELRRDFFAECYVPIEANNRHLLLSKNIIAARYKRASGEAVQPASLDATTATGRLAESATMGAGSRPIIVVGDIGVGKSSFFENLQLQVTEDDKVNTYFITVDLGSKATLTENIRSYVLDAVPDILRQRYQIDISDASFVRSIYNGELERFDRGVDGKLKEVDPKEYERARLRFLREKVERKDAHLIASLSHIAHGRKKRIILVLDNADQRSFKVQQTAYLIAQELASTRSLFVFLALRPSTFYLSKTSGALAAYQSKLFTISPPPADVVVEKRIAFALKVAEGNAPPGTLERIRLRLTSIVVFLRATLRSVRTNEDIRRFLSNITGGNTRAVIELITTFCGSPNVEAEKIIRLENEEGDYIVPLHEFTKHALLGEYAYFNPQSSLVACNVFDVSAADPREHFLCSLLVGYLSSNIGVRDNDGFISGEAIVAEMSRNGFLAEQTAAALRRLATKRLIETPHAHYRELPVEDDTDPTEFYYRATTIGIYHIRFWIGSFAFLDATSTDTPIFQEGPRELISALAASFDIERRLERATAFRTYLEEAWRRSEFDAAYFNFAALLDAQDHTFQMVQKVVARRAVAPGRDLQKRRPMKRGARGARRKY